MRCRASACSRTSGRSRSRHPLRVGRDVLHRDKLHASRRKSRPGRRRVPRRGRVGSGLLGPDAGDRVLPGPERRLLPRLLRSHRATARAPSASPSTRKARPRPSTRTSGSAAFLVDAPPPIVPVVDATAPSTTGPGREGAIMTPRPHRDAVNRGLAAPSGARSPRPAPPDPRRCGSVLPGPACALAHPEQRGDAAWVVCCHARARGAAGEPSTFTPPKVESAST